MSGGPSSGRALLPIRSYISPKMLYMSVLGGLSSDFRYPSLASIFLVSSSLLFCGYAVGVVAFTSAFVCVCELKLLLPPFLGEGLGGIDDELPFVTILPSFCFPNGFHWYRVCSVLYMLFMWYSSVPLPLRRCDAAVKVGAIAKGSANRPCRAHTSSINVPQKSVHDIVHAQPQKPCTRVPVVRCQTHSSTAPTAIRMKNPPAPNTVPPPSPHIPT